MGRMKEAVVVLGHSCQLRLEVGRVVADLLEGMAAFVLPWEGMVVHLEAPGSRLAGTVV